MKMTFFFGFLLYNLLGRKLFKSHSFFDSFRISKKIRYYGIKLMIKKIGKNVNIERGAIISRMVEIGDNSGIGVNSKIAGPTLIKNNVLMGPNCKIYTRNHKFSNIEIPIRLQGYSKERKVTIEENVWIGEGVSILPGVKIGEGSILGVGSVIREDIPKYSIVIGNPAEVVGFRRRKE